MKLMLYIKCKTHIVSALLTDTYVNHTIMEAENL
jgi:hypothetical protein